MASKPPEEGVPSSSRSHDPVYCSAQGPLHEQLHVTPLPPPATAFLQELSVCPVCGALSVCFREKCCCEGWWGKGITRLVFVQCAGLSSLACAYTPAGRNRSLLCPPGPGWATLTHCHVSLSASCSLSSSSLYPSSHFLPRLFKRLIQFSCPSALRRPVVKLSQPPGHLLHPHSSSFPR